MSPIEKVDAVLGLLAEDDSLRPFAVDAQIFEAFYLKHPNTRDETYLGSDLLRALDKLVRDEYVKRETVDVIASEDRPVFYKQKRYSITIAGIEHFECGGYAAANLERIALAQDRLYQRIRERNAEVRERQIVYLTVILAIGTVIPALYSILEIRQKHSGFYAKIFPFAVTGCLAFLFCIPIVYMFRCLNRKKPSAK